MADSVSLFWVLSLPIILFGGLANHLADYLPKSACFFIFVIGLAVSVYCTYLGLRLLPDRDWSRADDIYIRELNGPGRRGMGLNLLLFGAWPVVVIVLGTSSAMFYWRWLWEKAKS